MATVEDLPTGLITGQFLFVSQDNVDEGTAPNAVLVSGYVRFTCTATPPLLYKTRKVLAVPLVADATFDSQGHLIPLDPSQGAAIVVNGKLERGIAVLGDSPDVSPRGFNWQVSFNLREVLTGRTIAIPTYQIHVAAGETVDLSEHTPIGQSNGVSIIRGESAYEVAVAKGFVGTEVEWLETIKGAPGPNTIPTQQVLDEYVEQNLVVRVDENFDFPAPVTARQAARLGDATTPEGAAVGAQVDAVRKSLPAARPARGARLPLTMLTGSVYTPGGGVSATDVVLGSTNYYVQTAGDAAFASWHRWSAIAPQNLVGKGLVFMAKVTNGQNLAYLTVSAASDNGMAGYFQHRIPVPRDGKSPLREGEWAPIYVPWSAMNLMPKVGTPDASAIIAIKLTPSDIGGGKSVRLEIGSLIGVYTDPAATGSVMWSFDDSYVEAIPAAVKLASVGHRGVLHPIVERIDTTSAFLTTAQVLRLQDLYGWEIGAHCMTNAQHVSLVGQPRAQIESMLLEIREWQRSIGAESNAFAYPIGPFDKNAVEAVGAHYGYARTNDELPTPSRLPQPLQASAAALSATANSLATMKVVLDQVAANKSMINIVIHRLVNGATSAQNEWSMSDFNALVDHAVSLGLKNVTTAQVLALT